MGKFLEDMTRLCGEIRVLHGSRQTFRKELAEGNRERERDVAEMCADFAGSQARTAERMRDGRFAFLKDLKQTVSGQQRAIRTDLAGARRAWGGRGA
jgi:hypothetical protein